MPYDSFFFILDRWIKLLMLRFNLDFDNTTCFKTGQWRTKCILQVYAPLEICFCLSCQSIPWLDSHYKKLHNYEIEIGGNFRSIFETFDGKFFHGKQLMPFQCYIRFLWKIIHLISVNIIFVMMRLTNFFLIDKGI